jgi:hypothetical protein
MAEKGCWDINPGCGTGTCPDHCPALTAKTVCWKFNWPGVLDEMSPSDREHWSEFIKNRCIVCPIYLERPDDVESILNSL